MKVVAEADDGSSAIAMVEKYRPEIVLMDIRMPVLDGIEETRVISSRFPDAKVVVLTMYTGQTYSDAALQYLMRTTC